jgi:cysteinyl-tRNA synthetase
MTAKKRSLNPSKRAKLKLYACGPTVYNYFHIGNARAFVFFDVVRRYFEHLGYDVTYVQKHHDIDDKIIANQSKKRSSFIR